MAIRRRNEALAILMGTKLDLGRRMLELVLYFHERGMSIIKRGAPISVIHDLPIVDTLIRMKSNVGNDELNKLEDIQKTIDEQMGQLDSEYR